MRGSPETLIKAVLGESVAAVLAIVGLSISSAASAGVISLCDTDTIEVPDLDLDTGTLTVELIDLGSPVTIDVDIAVDTDALALPPPPDIDEMLKQMFDVYHDHDLTDKQSRVPETSPSLAELSAQPIETESPMLGTGDAGSAVDTDTIPPAVSTRVPGLSEDDLQRYRRKMYRTDI